MDNNKSKQGKLTCHQISCRVCKEPIVGYPLTSIIRDESHPDCNRLLHACWDCIQDGKAKWTPVS